MVNIYTRRIITVVTNKKTGGVKFGHASIEMCTGVDKPMHS